MSVKATKSNITEIPGFKVFTWDGITSGNTAEPVAIPMLGDKTVQVVATSTFSGSLQGSNDGTNFQTLNDPFGNPLTFTADGLKTVLENCAYIKPVVSTGTMKFIVTGKQT